MRVMAIFDVRSVFCAPVFILCLLVAQPCFPEEAEDRESILIRNVRLIDRQEQSDGVLVNILVVDTRLKIVTQDGISEDDISLTIDARGGFLLARLYATTDGVADVLCG